MIQSIKRAWIFLKQGWKFGQNAPVLLAPTLLSFLISFISLIVILVPLAGLVAYVRKDPLGQLVIGALIGLLVVLILGIFNIFSFMSANLACTRLTGGNPTRAQAWERISELGGSLFWVALGMPLQSFWINPLSLVSRQQYPTGWERAGHLFVPVASCENVKLGMVGKRIERMQADNCVFTADSVAIGTLNLLLLVGSVLVGAAAASGGTILLLKIVQDPALARALAFALAGLLLAIFVLPVFALTKTTRVWFNTCLYVWGVAVREARETGSMGPVVPEPLAVALGLKSGG